MGLRVITGMEDAGLSCSISKENKCLIYRKLTLSQNYYGTPKVMQM